MFKKPLLRLNGLNSLVLAACMLLGVGAQTLATEPERLSADRPGFAWGTHTVATGTLYVEGGFQFAWNPSISDYRYTNVPVINFRTGVANGIELFVSWDGWQSTPPIIEEEDNTFTDGLTMPVVGGKLRLKDSDAISLTVLGLLEPNQEDDYFAVNPSMALLWETPLSEAFDFFGMAMGNMEYTPDHSSFNLILAFGLATSITHSVDAFVEYFTIAQTANGKWLHGNEAGIQVFISNSLQLDVFAGFSHGNESDHYAGLGIAKRF